VDAGIQFDMTTTPTERYEIITLTPLSLRADSRTLKQASSIHRFGYASMVIEGPPSGFAEGELPFPLMSYITSGTTAKATAKTAIETAQDEVSMALAGQVEGSQIELAQAASSRETAPSLSELDLLRHADGAVVAEQGPVATDAGARISPEHHPAMKNKLHLLIRLSKSVYCKVLYVLSVTKYYRNIVFNKIRYLFSIMLYYKNIVMNKFNYYKSVMTYHKNVIYGRIRYNEPTAFLEHVLLTYRSQIAPTRRIVRPARLYYLHAPYQFPAIALPCLLGKSRYIYDAHDFYSHMDDHTRLPSFWTRWVLPWEGFIERICVRHASAIVTVNPAIAELMKARFKRDVMVLRNAHDPRLESKPAATLRQNLGLGPDMRLTVCIGQWKRDTAITQAMEAFEGLPDNHHLAFLGSNFPSYASDISRLGLHGRVHFHPAVKANEVVPFVRSADFGLLLYHAVSPSIRNCLPNGFFQPLAAGLPIFYPELPEIVRIAGPMKLGLQINPLDPTSIRDAVHRLSSDNVLHAEMKQRVEAARHELSWERDEEVLKKLVEGLIGPPQAA
jgi:hypothetical protein